MRPLLVLVLVLVLVLGLVASSCGDGEREEILVFAAASLTDALERLGEQFNAKEGVEVRFSLGGSTELAQQIVRHAPADAFVSAGRLPMDMLEEKGRLAQDTRVDLLTNGLVLVGRAGVSVKRPITSLSDLVDRDLRLVIADPDLAPAGWYAREALKDLGLWTRLEPRLVPALNVRFALGYLEAGTVDVAIVYRTDLAVTTDVEILAPIPKDSHPPIVYPAAVVEGSRHREAAVKFLAYLRTEEATATFLEYDFIPLLNE